jgi:hypothetical protein
MNTLVQFFLEPFNWVVLATVILSFLIEHFNQTNGRQTVRVRAGTSAAHRP